MLGIAVPHWSAAMTPLRDAVGHGMQVERSSYAKTSKSPVLMAQLEPSFDIPVEGQISDADFDKSNLSSVDETVKYQILSN